MAGRQIKKPIDIPRPGKKGKGDRGQRQEQPQQAPRAPRLPPSQQGPAPGRDVAFKQGISVLQQSARKRG